MTALVRLNGSDAIGEGLTLSGTVTYGINSVGVGSTIRRVRAAGTFSGGDVYIVGNSTHVLDVRSDTPDYAAVTTNDADRSQISQVFSTGSAAGCALRVTNTPRLTATHVHSLNDENGIIVENSLGFQITNFQVEGADGFGVLIDDSNDGILDGRIDGCGQHGLQITDSDDNRINVVSVENGADTANTYDNIILDATSSRNLITNSKLKSRTTGSTRYGVNVSVSTCVDNMVAGNAFGTIANYGTSPWNDAGTTTKKVFPNHATYGDNFTI